MARTNELHLPTDSPAVQEQNKAAWNKARRQDQADFFTVGYMRRDIHGFLATLVAAGVSTVLDVRHTPVSMYKPDFSKSNLARHLENAGIDYLHAPQFGVPRVIRGRAVGKPTRDVIWNWYDERVLPLLTPYHFFNCADHPIALLCVELDPTSCHRHRLALALERQGLRGFDL